MPRKAKPKDMTFARTLTRIMDERKIGVRDLADICGCSPSSITGYRNGVAPTDFKLVARIAGELDITMTFLLTGKEDERSRHRAPAITEVFDDGGELYDGYARIIIQKLIPKAEPRPVKARKRDE